jgi:hypothetical protein
MSGAFGLSVDRGRAIEWSGKVLSGWIMIDGVPTKVTADREAIHARAPSFNDALAWEFDKHSPETFEKLVPFFYTLRRG